MIKWVGSPNYSLGRAGRSPLAIVNHITAGLYPGTLYWLQNPGAKASAHYLVTKQGEIFQLVKDEDTAWANGIANQPQWSLYDGSNPNRYTLSIEHEALAGESLTEEQYQATLSLHQYLVEKWNIPVTNDNIIGHYRIDSINRPNDPGPGFPWERLFKDLQAIKDKEEQVMGEDWKQKIMQEAMLEGLITSQHQPDDPASKWFVLVVALNLLKKLRSP